MVTKKTHREPSQGSVAQWLMRLSCKQEIDNLSLKTLKLENATDGFKNKLTFFSIQCFLATYAEEPSQCICSKWLMPSEAWKIFRAYKLAETPQVEETFKLQFY